MTGATTGATTRDFRPCPPFYFVCKVEGDRNCDWQIWQRVTCFSSFPLKDHYAPILSAISLSLKPKKPIHHFKTADTAVPPVRVEHHAGKHPRVTYPFHLQPGSYVLHTNELPVFGIEYHKKLRDPTGALRMQRVWNTKPPKRIEAAEDQAHPSDPLFVAKALSNAMTFVAFALEVAAFRERASHLSSCPTRHEGFNNFDVSIFPPPLGSPGFIWLYQVQGSITKRFWSSLPWAKDLEISLKRKARKFQSC